MSRVLVALAATVAAAAAAPGLFDPQARGLHATVPTSPMGYPIPPNCTVETKQAILAGVKELMELTKAAYEAKGKVWYFKGQFVEAGCEKWVPPTAAAADPSAHRRLNDGAYPTAEGYWNNGQWFPPVTVNPEVCAAKAAALADAKKALALAVRLLAKKILALGTLAQTCLPTDPAAHRQLWEDATFATATNQLGFLASCLDKIKYLLEAALGIEKVVVAKVSYALTLEGKLATTLGALAVCEAKYPDGASTGYAAHAETLWGEKKIFAYEFYGQHYFAPGGEGDQWVPADEGAWDQYQATVETTQAGAGYDQTITGYFDTNGNWIDTAAAAQQQAAAGAAPVDTTYAGADTAAYDTTGLDLTGANGNTDFSASFDPCANGNTAAFCQYRRQLNGQGWYKFPACTELLQKVGWLQGEIAWVETKMLAAITEGVQVGTWLAAKAGKCFEPTPDGRRVL